MGTWPHALLHPPPPRLPSRLPQPFGLLASARTGCAPLPTGAEHRWAMLGFQTTQFFSPLQPRAANVVVGHQPLSALEGWLHFMLDCKGETLSCQFALCILAAGRAGPPAPCGVHGAAWSHPHCPPCKAMGLEGAPGDVLPGSVRKKPLIFRALVAFACGQASKFPVSQGKAAGGGKRKARRWH